MELLLTVWDKGSKLDLYADSVSIDTKSVVPITLLRPEVFKNGVLIQDFGRNFIGRCYDAHKAGLSIIRAYLNNDTTFSYENVADELKKARVTDHSVYFAESILPLQAVTKEGFRFYSDGDEFILVRKDGSLATDIKEFYENALFEEELVYDASYTLE